MNKEILDMDDIRFGVVVGRDQNGAPFVYALKDTNYEQIAWCERFLSRVVEEEILREIHYRFGAEPTEGFKQEKEDGPIQDDAD